MVKIFNYIFVRVPEQSSNYELGIPYTNYLWYETGLMIINKPPKQISKLFPKEYLIKQGFYGNIKERKAIPVKYILFGNPKFRYHIIGKVFNYVIIKIN